MSHFTFDTVPFSSPPADKRYSRASIKAFNGTKKEEVAVLRHLSPKYTSFPYKGPLNINLWEYALRNGLKDAVYKDIIQLLNKKGMSDLDVYVSIQDLLNAVFCATVVNTNLNMRKDTQAESIGRYVYSATLADCLLFAFW